MVELAVEFAGTWFRPGPGRVLEIGREGDIELDDNPYLHRRFLRITQDGGLWWLANVGGRLSVTVCDAAGGVQSWLSPGTSIPIVFPATSIVFTAGPTTYELLARLDGAPYTEVLTEEPAGGTTTIGISPFTTSQRQLVVALCEPMLRRDGSGLSELPSTADAAARLGWTTTRFNRKLDNVCEKLDRVGVQGLRGSSGAGLATNRRARLVEYAVASRLVTADDLPLLDAADESDTE